MNTTTYYRVCKLMSDDGMHAYIYNRNHAGIYFFTVNNGNTRTMCEIGSDLTTKTLY